MPNYFFYQFASNPYHTRHGFLLFFLFSIRLCITPFLSFIFRLERKNNSENSLTGVQEQVVFQIGVFAESSVANVTFERPRTVVYVHVRL